MEPSPDANQPRTISVSERRWRAFKAAAVQRGLSLPEFLAYLIDKAERDGEFDKPSAA